MLRWLSAISGRPMALAGSVMLHAAAIVAGGHAVSGIAEEAPAPAPVVPVSVDLEAPAPVPVPPERQETAPVRAASVSRAAMHHHSYPVPPDHDDHPHDPSVVHMPLAAPPMEAEKSADPPVFVLRAPVVSQVAAPSRESITEGSIGSGAGRSAGEATFSEGEVDAPAGRLTSPKIDYPPAAATAGIEADVPVEIVIDTQGVVVSARALEKSGYGLDEEAVRAARASRFSPARRGGRPVRVRMRWNILFRLP
jgi:TonB family protein